jgi:hypothetical protein
MIVAAADIPAEQRLADVERSRIGNGELHWLTMFTAFLLPVLLSFHHFKLPSPQSARKGDRCAFLSQAAAPTGFSAYNAYRELS